MITLATPEATPSRTRARLIGLIVNADAQTAIVQMRLTDDSDSTPRVATFRIPAADFATFLQAASIDRRGVEQYVATNFLPGTVS